MSNSDEADESDPTLVSRALWGVVDDAGAAAAAVGRVRARGVAIDDEDAAAGDERTASSNGFALARPATAVGLTGDGRAAALLVPGDALTPAAAGDGAVLASVDVDDEGSTMWPWARRLTGDWACACFWPGLGLGRTGYVCVCLPGGEGSAARETSWLMEGSETVLVPGPGPGPGLAGGRGTDGPPSLLALVLGMGPEEGKSSREGDGRWWCWANERSLIGANAGADADDVGGREPACWWAARNLEGNRREGFGVSDGWA